MVHNGRFFMPWCIFPSCAAGILPLFSEERFHEAEMLSLQLERARSLASTLCSARRAQEREARRENFGQAKRFRDDAREAEVWLLQTVRDASVRVGTAVHDNNSSKQKQMTWQDTFPHQATRPG